MSAHKWLLCATVALCLVGCGGKGKLRVALSADYPPFEYVKNGKIVGFDVDLSDAIGGELGRDVLFKDMAFAAILPALSGGMVDMAASTIAVTDERKKNYAFTRTYFCEELYVLHMKSKQPAIGKKFFGMRVACQMGTTMEMWLRQNAPDCKIQSVDSNVQAVEALLAGLVDAVIVDGSQAKSFCEVDGRLDSTFLAKSDSGYAIALKKNSPLVEAVDGALEKLEKNGTVDRLKKKWGLM